ncbi:AAA family ATPase [Leucobacter luti]|uniref:AAA family ATPase n=1 Tax=Leucobacter luti TaxID=340320 RepID=UPI003CFF3B3F
MRILTLELEGFGPFRDRQRLDFERAAEGGILLITGRTGAGKSSILDAVSFALYGSVPRYDGQVGRVRSDHLPADRGARVTLEFEMAGERFRVERSPEWERPKKRGEGTTTQKQEAELWRWDEAAGDWRGMASRPVDVAAELAPVLGLSHEQFLQVVLLAQGGFQRFLRAGDQERQATLRTLFRTQHFAEVERLLAERRRSLSEAAELRDARIVALLDQAEAEAAGDSESEPGSEADADGDAEPDGGSGARTQAARRDEVAAAVSRLEQRVMELTACATEREAEREEAQQQLGAIRSLAERQARLAAARELSVRLEARDPEMAEVRRTLSLAERAAAVQRPLERAERAGERRAAADRALGEALAAAAELTPDATAGEEPAQGAGFAPGESREWLGLRSARDDAGALLAVLGEARARESRHAELVAEAAQIAAERERAVQASDQAGARTAELPAQVADAGEAARRAAVVAEARVERAAAVERATAAAEAARRAESLAPELERAREVSAEEAARAARAATAVSELLARRLSGMAGELAESLEPESACPVCGSREHPAPAEREDPVGEDEIAAAESASAAAQARLERARAAERSLDTELAANRAAAGSRNASAANAELERALQALAEAERAGHESVQARSRLEQLERDQREATAKLAAARESLARLEQAAETNGRLIAESEEQLARDRGGYGTVAERFAATSRRHTALETALAAALAAEAAVESAREAEAVLGEALAASGFETADAARAAALPADERERLGREVEEHSAAVLRNAGVLEDPELAGLPEQPADVASREAVLAEARAAAVAASAAEATARERADARRSQLARIDAEIAGAAEGSAELMRLRRLADAVQGKEPNTRRMRLEAFVLAARLEAIVAAANERLGRMVGGRYLLQHDDGLRSRGRQSGLGLSVLDEYTGRERTTDSLSGGETFLASLALALGLADVVTAESGGIRLDTLFIDEGFGTLDPDALDQALATLDTLREGGRTVALISHVAELRERLPAQLEVVVDDRGVSSLRGDGVIELAEQDASEARAEQTTAQAETEET